MAGLVGEIAGDNDKSGLEAVGVGNGFFEEFGFAAKIGIVGKHAARHNKLKNKAITAGLMFIFIIENNFEQISTFCQQPSHRQLYTKTV